MKHQGQDVTVVRDARAGDPDFDAAKDQVIVRMPDSSEKTVLRSELAQ